MAAALECWSSRTNTNEEMVEQMLVTTQDRSERSQQNSPTTVGAKESSAVQKRLQRLTRNVSEAIASLKNSLNLDSARGPPQKIGNCRSTVWAGIIRNLTQLYPGSQIPEKLVSNLRKHFDSLPMSYSEAGFEMKDVFLHMRLIEQALVDDHTTFFIQEVSNEEVQGTVYKLTFACSSSVSWLAISSALDSVSICCKNIQIFEKKGFTLGIVILLVQDGQDKLFKVRIENALKLAVKKPKAMTMKLPFGLCGCHEENYKGSEIGEINDDICEKDCGNGTLSSSEKIHLQMPLPDSSYMVCVDEWQTWHSSGEDIGKWLFTSVNIEFIDQIGPNLFKGGYKEKRVRIQKLKGCDKGSSYEFKLRKDLLVLMTCGHKNIQQFYGICIDENHGLCVVSELMECGSVHDAILKNKVFYMEEILRIATDVAEGLKFMNDHGLSYAELNTQRILLDRYGYACLGDMGIVTACKSVGEAMEYETDGYRWLAPEIIAGDPESVTETWMSNVYSFGMVIWEMVTGEAAYSAYSPVQAAVGIAACGLRPEIPKDCPQILKSLMEKCWNSCPVKRPQFSEILSILPRPKQNHC